MRTTVSERPGGKKGGLLTFKFICSSIKFSFELKLLNKDLTSLGAQLLGREGRNMHSLRGDHVPGPSMCVYQATLRTSLCGSIVATYQIRRPRREQEVQPPTHFRPLRSSFPPPFPTAGPLELFPTFEVTTVKPVKDPVTSFRNSLSCASPLSLSPCPP